MKLTDLTGGADPFTVTVAGVVVPTAYVGAVVINHGRSTADTRPDASTCALSLKAAGVPAWPVLGDSVTVDIAPAMLAYLGAPADAARRFTGRVTDPSVTVATGVIRLVAVGPLSRLSRLPIGDTPWPAESDGARAARILAAAAALDTTLVVGTVDPGTVTVVARDVDRQPAGTLLEELAAYTGGDVWQTRAGVITWHDAAHRASLNPAVVLDASDVLAAAVWAQSLDGLLTDLTVGYGVPVYDAATGSTSQPEVRVTDTAAEDPANGLGFGSLSARVTTPLAALADAEAYARDQVGRRSAPRWRVPSLAVDVLRTLDPVQAAAVLSLEPAALLEVVGLPSTGPLSNSRLWLEGWTEEITRTSWRLGLAVTAYGQTGPAPMWADVPENYQPATPPGGTRPAPLPLTWADVPAGISWLSAVGYWPGDADAGRWLDEPANTRWADAPADIEWTEVP